jgi:hypothetical protein
MNYCKLYRLSSQKSHTHVLFGGSAMIRGSAAPRLPAGRPASCSACPLGSPWSGGSIRHTGRGCQGEPGAVAGEPVRAPRGAEQPLTPAPASGDRDDSRKAVRTATTRGRLGSAAFGPACIPTGLLRLLDRSEPEHSARVTARREPQHSGAVMGDVGAETT